MGPVGCRPWFPGGLCPMLVGALSGGFLCSLLGGCVVVPAASRVQFNSMLIVALYTYTLITKHGYHVGPVPCVSHVHGFCFVCLCVCFFSACLLSGAPGGSKAGFHTEAVGCRLFCFYRCSSWLSGFSLFFL